MTATTVTDIPPAVHVQHFPDGKLWPEGESRDYSKVHAATHIFQHRLDNGHGVTQRYRIYNPYSAYGNSPLPPGMPRAGRFINNVDLVPGNDVLDQMIGDLEAVAHDHPVLYWDSAIQCFPRVAQHLKRLFRLTILNFGDDLPGSSDIKTFPVARYFDVLAHSMWIWDATTGKTVPEVYAEHGLTDCRFYAWGPMSPDYTNEWFARKIDALRTGATSLSLVWLGNIGNAEHRQRALVSIGRAFASDPRSRFYGFAMRDGKWPGTAAEVYARATFGLNVPEGSFFNGRFADLCMSGTIQLVHDPHGELTHFGFLDGHHLLCYDGTAAGLKARLAALDRDGLVRIAISARDRFIAYRHGRSMHEVHAEILLDYERQIREGRQ